MTVAEQIVSRSEIGLLAIDLRGTLISTPRVTRLLPELRHSGVQASHALIAQKRFDEQLRGPLQSRGDIIDWTRLAAEQMAATLRAAGHPAIDVDRLVTTFRTRYLRESKRLIGRGELRRAWGALGSRCAIIADGPLEREAAVLGACFGDNPTPPLISSECLGVNKLSAEFFVRLSRRCGVAPTAVMVVGDRWDKDVLIPRSAGCRGLLVGSPAPDGSSMSLGDLLTLLIGGHRCPAE